MNRRSIMNRKIIILLIFTLLIPLSLLIMSCDVLTTQVENVNPDDNPIDPDNPDYEPPLAIISEGPENGSTINDDFVTFKWYGNEEDCEFSYRLDDDEWSEWNADSIVNYDYLDEINHIFEVKAKFSTDSVQNVPSSVSFTVNAIEGPALWLYNKKIETSVNSTFSVYVIAEEVTELAMMSVVLNFDPAYLEIQEYEVCEDDSILNGRQLIQVNNCDNAKGLLTVYLALVSNEQESLNGSGPIIRVVFNAMQQGISNISFDNGCYFRKANNNPIEIISKVSSLIEIK